ncbi:MAG: AMP-dependent synthetase/ligase [Panacagrimonas sp.]
MNTASLTPPVTPAMDPSRVHTLAQLYAERLRLSPHAEACRHFDARSQAWSSHSWTELAATARAYIAGMHHAGLRAGDRIALQLSNGPEWLAADWAANHLGLVTVGLFPDETSTGTAQLLNDCGARLLLTRDLSGWNALSTNAEVPALRCVVPLRGNARVDDRRVQALTRFLGQKPVTLPVFDQGDALASIVYTSGATGRPKGVMLSHRNLLSNAFGCAEAQSVHAGDEVFSVLPVAHLYGRVAGVYASIVQGACLIFGRGAGHVAEDLLSQKPTVLIGVPRIFERIHGALLQELDAGPATRRAMFRLAVDAGWAAQRKDVSALKVRLLPTGLTRRAGDALRERLGGRLRLAVSGGASLSPQIGRVFTALGIPLLQGYGLTETGPVVSVNRVEDNDPASAGLPLRDVETRIEANGELHVRGPGVMLGYWQDQDGTRAVLDEAGWLRTGDKVSRLDTHRIYLVGRLKELLVTATGEKASPADIEARLRALPLVEQVMVVGEARPYLTALIVPQPGPLAMLRAEIGLTEGDDSSSALLALEEVVLQRCQELLRDAPRNHWILRVALIQHPWTPQNQLLTATQKLRRCEIARAFEADINRLYDGHYTVAASDCSSNAAL